jgi:hypothetical protein
MPFKRIGRGRDGSPSSSPTRDRIRGGVDGAIVALKLAKESADWNPIMKAVLGGVSAMVDLCRVSSINHAINSSLHQTEVHWTQQFRDNKEEWKKLATYVEEFSNQIKESLPDGDQSPSSKFLANMKQLLEWVV